MVGVDVSRNLEDEASELRLLRTDLALLGFRRPWRRGYLDKAVEQFLHAEVVQGRAEEDRGHLSRAISLDVELRIDAVHEFKVLAQFGGILLAYPVVQLGGIDLYADLLSDALFVRRKEVKILFVNIIDALEPGTLVDGP